MVLEARGRPQQDEGKAHMLWIYFANTVPMAGLHIGGRDEVPDWPKMDPSLLIATRLILQYERLIGPRSAPNEPAMRI
jgi:hypothetical protein